MKQNWIDRAISFVSPAMGAARAKSRYVIDIIDSRAGYDAAGAGRRNTWVRGSDSSQNAENKRSLTILRARHREQARNNVYAASAIDTRVSVTVGEGIIPVAKHSNKRKAALANELMQEWAKSTWCDADGSSDLYGLESLIMRAQSESGEAVLIRQFDNTTNNRVPLRIRLVEGDYIDECKNGSVDGYEVIQGVALRQGKSGKSRAGYYIHENHPGEVGARSSSKFVSADQVAHIYEILRPGQLRGIPPGVSGLARMRNLDELMDAIVEQQKVAACLVGFIQQGEEGKANGDVLPSKLEPGLLAKLGMDESVTFNTLPSMSGQETIIQKEEHLIAKSYGINYQSLVGDLSNANFANGKLGRLDMYANVRRWRKNMLIPMALKRIEKWFIEAAVLAGHNIEGVTFDWTPPRTEILNLRDDIPALIKQIRSGLGSFSGVARSLGYPDAEALLKEIKEDADLIDKLELILDSDPRRTSQSGQLQSQSAPTEKEPKGEEEPEE
ncbi:phage portal protein [Porticoccaceae bacterium]|nr:phage portal protein [Porticoccaceae bacterium]